ncbi:MAG: RNA 2',3'-cyclic phosphodiesterase [Chloroflexota bacterium]|nr:RNA 2',3'-cyclic phosphodiesterase [Chloroflexota bacterium]
MDTLRVFVAIELPDDVKRVVADAIDSLRRARIDNLRLVRPEGVHLTLKFLGDIDVDRVAVVKDAMAQAVAAFSSKRRSDNAPNAPFCLTLGTTGVFPNANRARVLWVGVDGDMPALRSLQVQVEDALIAAGFPATQQQRFNPHLTVGRMHHRASRADRQFATDALSALQLPTTRIIAVNGISLMRSTLLPGGAKYDRIAHADL